MQFLPKAGLALATLAVLGLAAVQPAAAQTTVYDNGAPNQLNGNEMTEWIQAEDFTLTAPTTFDTIQFADVDANSYAGSLTYQFYTDNGGTPGTLLSSTNTTAVTRTATGNTLFFGTENINDIAIGSTTLGPGTYWLGLHNGDLTNTGRAEFYWETTDPNSTTLGEEFELQSQTGFSPNGQEHSFQLINNAPVPEASTTASFGLLLALGVGGLAVAAKRKKQVA